MGEPQAVLRYTVFGLVVLAAIVALGSWLVRTRRVSPFGVLGRTLRSVTDPVVRPVERRLVRMGGNPVHAGGWLVVLTAVAGIVLVSLAGWLVGTFQTARAAASGGPRGTFTLIVDLAYRILFAALIVRVIASWLGMFRYSRWIRPAYLLTDWFVEPIRRVVPPLGAMDLSPLVAMIVLSIVRQILLSIVRPG
jgi:YggT family protein